MNMTQKKARKRPFDTWSGVGVFLGALIIGLLVINGASALLGG